MRNHLGKWLAAIVLATVMVAGSVMPVQAGSEYTFTFDSEEEFRAFCEQMGITLTEEASAENFPTVVGPDGRSFVDARTNILVNQYPAGVAPLTSVKKKGKDVYYKGVRAAVDSIPLYPEPSTGNAQLDLLLDQIFAQILTPDMDTHDKMKACYDYLINTLEYGNNGAFAWSDYDRTFAALTTGIGVCDDYSSAFAVMCWKLGIPMCVAQGQTSKAKGGFTPHAWCVLPINGTFYVFDPQVEDNIARSRKGKPMYIRFGGNMYTQLAKNYQIERLYD